jgi:predicted lipoprotein
MMTTLRFPLRGSLWLAVPLALCACPVIDEDPPGEVQRRKFSTNVTDEIIVPRLTSFAAQAAALRDALAAHDTAGGNDVVSRDAARDAWRAAMATWQELEMLHLGPAASPATFVGGLGLRERIYAWPQINVCALDAQLLAGEFREDGWVDTRLPNVIGLAAVEYTLFVDSDANGCPDSATMNAAGTWDALGADEIKARRASYASIVADDVAQKAEALRAAWLDGVAAADGVPATAPFAEALRSAGEEGSAFPTAQQALDELYAALFALELVTKDQKLGIPAGVHVGCETATCPERAESRFARTSKENIAANLAVMRAVFLGIDRNGVDDTGFDDLLRERGADDLAAAMITNLDVALAAAQGFDGTLEDALLAEPERVVALHGEVKSFTDDLKSSFPSVLGLRVPEEGAGDND